MAPSVEGSRGDTNVKALVVSSASDPDSAEGPKDRGRECKVNGSRHPRSQDEVQTNDFSFSGRWERYKVLGSTMHSYSRSALR